ncbi:MAG: hypothetical protein ACI90U_002185 [Pseudomonadales bacterium]|jgi:hypothetical protein
MSYILSALKKAEAERREQSGDADLSVMVEPRVDNRRSRAPGLIAAVISMAALAAWLWLARSGVPVVVNTTEAVISLSGPAASNYREPVKNALLQKQALVAQNSVFDNVDIKGHLYVATRPSLRKVVINDRTLREGEQINGILVEEITETGVLLSFGGVEKTISAY